MARRASPLLTAAVAAGCALAPKYTRPGAPISASWPAGAAYPEVRSSSAAPAAAELGWREFFTDVKLRQAIEIALQHNRDLRLAALNVELARAIYGIQRAELWPALNAVGAGSKQRVPADLSLTGKPATSEQYGVNLGVASWEIDFFGRIRSLKARALQQYLATEQARRSAQILLVAGVAQAYLTLAADQESLALAQTTLASQLEAHDLIKSRHALGLVSDLDLYRAQTQVDAARRDEAQFRQMAAQGKNVLDLLLGVPAPAGLLPTGLGGVMPPRDVSAGLASDVLLFRPDVLRAEGQLRAAYADIGAARAALFPRIVLTASAGTASRELSGLFAPGSGAWSFSPQIVMPIFDARIWSALRASQVQRQIVLTQYEQAIQTAFREVADALAVCGTVDQQVAAQQSLTDAVAKTYRLAQSRYDKNIDSYLGVLDAQRTLYAAQQGLVSLRLAKLAGSVRLYAVLGGGWQAGPAPGPGGAPAPAPER